MELSGIIAIRLIIAVAVILTVLGLFGVSWAMRLRIIGALAVGTFLLGFFPWSLVKPSFPLGAITLQTGDITVFEIALLVGIGLVVGFIAYFVCYPRGSEIAYIAVPAGMSIWSLRTGNMMSLLQLNDTLEKRQALYSVLRWESFIWLVVVAAGFAGVFLASKVYKDNLASMRLRRMSNSNPNKILLNLVSLATSVVIGHFVIGILAQDVRLLDNQLGSVVGQPEVPQIAFAVVVAFVAAGFVGQVFLDSQFIASVAAAAVSSFVAVHFFAARSEVMRHMIENWPAAFFPRASCAILPIQFVSFGAVGSIVGYWLGVRYQRWHGR